MHTTCLIRRRRLLLAVLVAAVALSPAGEVRAAKPSGPSADGDAYYPAVVERLIGLQEKAVSQERIDRILAREFGWVPVAGGGMSAGGRQPLASDNGDVTLSTPRVYFNTQMGRYEVSATFTWRNCTDSFTGVTEPCYVADGTSPTNMGGYDAFGIRVSKEVMRRSQQFVVSTNTNCRQWYTNPADADGWGVVYRNQDGWKNPCGTSHYNWHRGTVVYGFMTMPGCPKGPYQFSTKMGHTWRTSGVSGISVGSGGISISFSTTDHHWTAVSNNRTWYPCGT